MKNVNCWHVHLKGVTQHFPIDTKHQYSIFFSHMLTIFSFSCKLKGRAELVLRKKHLHLKLFIY